jgi:hypothetical protein
MKISSAVHYTLSACAAAAVLAGCSSVSQPPLSPSGATGSNLQSANGLQAFGQSGLPNRERSRSWMSPDTRGPLLYISDRGTNEVYAYSYKKKVLVGTLTGFNSPDGLCVDGSGNIFVTEFGAQDILEYAHGGTSPIATLSDAGEKPMGCSVDATTGNLAVTNFQNASRASGNVAVYQAASGTPTLYSDANIYNYLYCVYDTKSNLYIDGKTYNGLDAFAELPKNSATFTDLTLNATINYAEDIGWKNDELIVGNTYENNQIYWFKMKNGKGMQVGYPAALTHGYGILQFWIHGKVLIGALPSYPNVSFWNYPAGGLPIYDIGFGGSSEPVGVAVSP